MIQQKMIDWGTQGCQIREIAAYGDARAEVVGAENVFNFTIGNPSVQPPACVGQSIKRLLSQMPAEQLHAYTPAPGLYSVRGKMAEHLNRSFGMHYRAEDIYMTSGASSALAMLCAALLSPGEEILALAPYFSEYKLYAEAAGGTFTPVPCTPDTFQIDLAAVERAIGPSTAAMFLNSPNNPSGVVLTRESLTALAELLQRKSAEYRHPIYVIADEPYRELVYGGVQVPFMPSIYQNTVFCYSLSKSLSLPGERVGFLALTPGMTDYDRLWNAILGAGRALGYICVSSMYQLVAADCIGQTADISIYEENRNLIYGALCEMGYRCVQPDGAFYLFVKSPLPDADEFFEKAKALDLLMVPGDSFGCPGYLRLAYCVSGEMLQRSLPKFSALARACGLKG